MIYFPREISARKRLKLGQLFWQLVRKYWNGYRVYSRINDSVWSRATGQRLRRAILVSRTDAFVGRRGAATTRDIT